MHDFPLISRPLTNLLKKDSIFVWSQEAEEAFQHLKTALISALVLALPQFNKQFEIEIDVSEFGIGVVLMQNGHPLAFFSKALGPKHRGLSTYEKEFMAILLAVERWRSYLQGGEFVIRTDHSSLAHLGDQRLVTSWQRKAYTKLMGLQYRIMYKKGSENKATDALSRMDAGLSAISVALPSWLADVVQGYQHDEGAWDIIQ